MEDDATPPWRTEPPIRMSLSLPGAASEHPNHTQCSAKGCRCPAAYALLWRNPKIHPEDRCKTWLACAEHKDDLAGFLSMRKFPLQIVPIKQLD